MHRHRLRRHVRSLNLNRAHFLAFRFGIDKVLGSRPLRLAIRCRICARPCPIRSRDIFLVNTLSSRFSVVHALPPECFGGFPPSRFTTSLSTGLSLRRTRSPALAPVPERARDNGLMLGADPP